MRKIVKYIIVDILRNKIVIAYTLFLLAISLGVLNLEDNPSKGLLSLMNVVLFVVPLVSIIFSTIYVYNSSEFIELLVSHPLKRKTLWLSLFSGLSISLSVAFLVGCGIPLVIFNTSEVALTMLVIGLVESIIFVAIALFAAVKQRDKAKGIGVAILLWVYFSLLFDGLVLFLLFQFSDYPIEKAMIGISSLNPVDLGRILILLKMDVSAMMGYTGAIFKDFFGTLTGLVIISAVLLAWISFPLLLSLRQFNRKDL